MSIDGVEGIDQTPLVEELGTSTEMTDEFRQAAKSNRAKKQISVFRAALVLLNMIMGVGLLSIPYCFRTGIVTNIFILLIIGTFAFLSFMLLVDSAATACVEIDYSKLILCSFRKNLTYIPHSITFLTVFGVSILHLQYSGSIIATVLDQIDGVPKWLYNRWFLIMVPVACVDLPLMFLKSIHGLSYVSMFTGVLMCMYLVHAIFYFGVYTHDYGFDPDHKIQFVAINEFFIPAMSIQAFAFTCHPVIGPTIASLVNPTRQRKYLTLGLVVIASGICYLIGGLLPYLTLFDKIVSAIVFGDYLRDHPKQLFTLITTAIFGAFLTVTTPLLLFAARHSFNEMLFGREFTNVRYYFIGIGILVSAALLAVTVRSIPVMFGFIGGVCGTLLVYILPAIYYIRICGKQNLVKYVISWIMIPAGIAFLTVCLYDSIRGLLN